MSLEKNEAPSSLQTDTGILINPEFQSYQIIPVYCQKRSSNARHRTDRRPLNAHGKKFPNYFTQTYAEQKIKNFLPTPKHSKNPEYAHLTINPTPLHYRPQLIV